VTPGCMHLKVLLPYGVFVERADVSRIVAETHAGSYGFLPRRRDCIAVLIPGILMFETGAGGPSFLAVDGGVLIKTGPQVRVSVRRAVGGAGLEQLHALVAKEFLELDERERDARLTMARLESGFLHNFAALQYE